MFKLYQTDYELDGFLELPGGTTLYLPADETLDRPWPTLAELHRAVRDSELPGYQVQESTGIRSTHRAHRTHVTSNR